MYSPQCRLRHHQPDRQTAEITADKLRSCRVYMTSQFIHQRAVQEQGLFPFVSVFPLSLGFIRVKGKNDVPLTLRNEIWMQGNSDRLQTQRAAILIYTIRAGYTPLMGPPGLTTRLCLPAQKFACPCTVNKCESAQPHGSPLKASVLFSYFKMVKTAK